ncbi:MAG TPA: hypothetical protein VNR39_10600 [Pseudolabrys sp.]|nr:hypothetical protein [Pseudolabrys sp.]
MTGSRNQAFLFMILGFAVWAAAFSILYGVQGTGCELGWHRQTIGPLSLLRILLIVIWGAHLAALAWVYWCCRAALAVTSARAMPEAFLWRAASALTITAAVATVWIGFALLVPSICVI